MKLQEHQQRVQNKLKKTPRLLVYHGLGSGKTLTALASREGKTTAVVPASLRTNIGSTVKKFGLSDKNLNVFSYEMATKKRPLGDTLIVDEAHRVGASETARSKALRDTSKHYKKVILLTGSPIRNKPHEIAPIAEMLGISKSKIPLSEKGFNEKFVEDREDKISVFEKLRGIKPGTTKYIKNEKAFKEAFKGKVDYYQAPKKDYPSVVTSVEKVEMSPEQHSLYRKLTNKLSTSVAYKVKEGRPMTASELQKANAFLTASRLLSNTGRPFGGQEETPKLKKLVSNIEKDPKGKHLVYSSFLEGGINPVFSMLKKKKIKQVRLDGSMSDVEKSNAVEAFNKNKAKVLLISGAGAEGIDLKGTRQIHIMEPHWNEARIDQVIGRGARYKSHSHLPEKDRTLKVTKYLSMLPKKGYVASKLSGKERDGGADEYMMSLSEKKEKLNQQFLNALKN